MASNYYDSTPLVECDIEVTKEQFLEANIVPFRGQRFLKKQLPLILLIAAAYFPLYVEVLNYGIGEYILVFAALNVFLVAVLVLQQVLINKETVKNLEQLYTTGEVVFKKERVRLYKYTYQRENEYIKGEYYWSEGVGCVETKGLFIVIEKREAPPFVIPKASLTKDQQEKVKRLLTSVYAKRYRYINR